MNYTCFYTNEFSFSNLHLYVFVCEVLDEVFENIFCFCKNKVCKKYHKNQ